MLLEIFMKLGVVMQYHRKKNVCTQLELCMFFVGLGMEVVVVIVFLSFSVFLLVSLIFF